MSTFYVGFLAGALYSPRFVERVGHIRVFGALASVASASVLIHGIIVTPLAWSLLRLVSGFCLAGL
jgi:MFS family permease